MIRPSFLCVLLAVVPSVHAFVTTPRPSVGSTTNGPLFAAAVLVSTTSMDFEPSAAIPSQPINLYSLLGATGSETRDELRRLYRRRVRLCHPDASRRCHDSVDEFMQVAQAYSILSDPKRRLHYDRTLKAEQFTQQACDCMNQVVDGAAKAFVTAMDWMEQTASKFANQNPQDRSHRQTKDRAANRSKTQFTSNRVAREDTSVDRMDWRRVLHTQLAVTATVALTVGLQVLRSWTDGTATGSA